jgi:hypothetical protein
MNSNRNRWLIAALGLVAVLYFGDIGYRKFFEEPASKNERLKEQLGKRLKTAKLDLAKSKQVGQQLESIEQKSLPWDAEIARSRYQSWLLETAKVAKLTNTSVDSGDPIAVTKSGGRGNRPIELYKRFTFSLRGRGTLGQVTKFMYDFYRAGHLHKIRSMSLNPMGQAEEVDLNISVEALALPNADREAELTTLVSEELALPDVRDYHLIAQRNFFGRGGTQSAWEQIRLSAVTSDIQGVEEAWFKIGSDRQTRILQVGQALSMPSFDVRLVELDATGAKVEVAEQLYHMSIGQNLAQAAHIVKVPQSD